MSPPPHTHAYTYSERYTESSTDINGQTYRQINNRQTDSRADY